MVKEGRPFVKTPVMQTYSLYCPNLHTDVDNTVTEGDIGLTKKNTLAGALIVVDFIENYHANNKTSSLV